MWNSLWISLQLAGVTSLILLVVALPLAALLAFKKFKGRGFLEVLIALPLVLPPTVLGYFVLILIAPKSNLGRMWNLLFDSSLAFSFSGMVFASLLYSFPFAIQPMQQAFRAVPKSWLELAQIQGLNRLQTFIYIILPASKQGILTAFAFSFAHTMGEFGVVLMVGGSIPGQTKVASIALFEFVEMQQNTEANMLALLLLGISFALLSLVSSLRSRVGSLRVQIKV